MPSFFSPPRFKRAVFFSSLNALSSGSQRKRRRRSRECTCYMGRGFLLRTKKKKKKNDGETMRSTRQFIKIGKPHQTSLLYFIGETSVVLLQRKCTLHWFASFSFLSAGSMSVSDAMIEIRQKRICMLNFSSFGGRYVWPGEGHRKYIENR